MNNTQRYDLRGVSASKEDVHNAIKNIDKGIFPKAFCKIIPDILCGDCNIMHADGAGTKSSLAYAYWKETGDMSVWKGIAQDSLIMNLDDLLCVGATDNILLSSTIGRNKRLIPGEVIAAIINGTEELLAELRELGIGIYSTGGETADIGDLVRTIVVDSTVTCRMRRDEVIDNAHIAAGDAIVGLASFGKAIYEKEYKISGKLRQQLAGRSRIFRKAKTHRTCSGNRINSREIGPFPHSHLCACHQKDIGLHAPRYSWHGTLQRRRTNKSDAFCRTQTCDQKQPIPHPAIIPHH